MKKGTTSSAIKILEDIINLDGKCLEPTRCQQCPLRQKCHPTFYRDTGKARFRDYERVNHASDIITNVILMGDDEYGREDNLAQKEH